MTKTFLKHLLNELFFPLPNLCSPSSPASFSWESSLSKLLTRILISDSASLETNQKQVLVLKGTTEDEMVGWHHQFSGHKFEQAPGDGDRQGSLGCCSPWGSQRVGHNRATELNFVSFFIVVDLQCCTSFWDIAK